MRFACGDMRDHIVSYQNDLDLRIGAGEPCGSRPVQESTLARFSGSYDFRLLQQYRRKADLREKLTSAKCPISVLSDFWRVHMFSKFRVTRLTTSRSHPCAG